MQKIKSRTLARIAGAVVVLAACTLSAISANAQSKEPIKIGFGMAMTGPLGPNGKPSGQADLL
jgi:branched-chain amino acid transport system substrate-binding protein